MQTLDVQNDLQPVNYTEAVQSSNSEKKTAKEPDRKGASFLDMIKNLMAEASTARAAGGEKTAGNREAAEGAAHKNNAAAQSELSRLKIKGNRQKPDAQVLQAEIGVREAENAEPLLETDALFAFEEGIEIKKILDSEAGDNRHTLMQADTGSEETVLLSGEELLHTKKRKTGKTESGIAAASGTEGLSGKQVKKPEEAADRNGLEKGVKTAQVKQQKPVFTVIDERTVHAAPVTADGSVHEAGAAVRIADAPSVDMALDFRSMAAGTNTASGSAHAARESGSAQSFSSLVAQQVQDMAPDFVQAGRIVLQDNNAGIIRLQMQPAHLGNVRINLELAGGKKIVGKIITGSKEAYEAFKESLDQLAKAFEQGGFASAQFDVSWSGEGGGRQFDSENSQFNELFAQNDRLEVMQGNRYADTETVYTFGKDQAVNVFA